MPFERILDGNAPRTYRGSHQGSSRRLHASSPTPRNRLWAGIATRPAGPSRACSSRHRLPRWP